LVSVTGNVNGGNLVSGALVQGATVSSSGNVVTVGVAASGNISATANVQGGNGVFTTIVSAASHTGTIVSVTGNITGGNLITAALVQGATVSSSGNVVTVGLAATGNISTTGNISGGNFIGAIVGTSSTLTGNLSANNVIATTIVNAASLTGGLVSVSGNITGANLILNGTAAAGSGVLIVSGNIQTSTANATANIGNASNYFNRLFAQATTALYADLAEMYTTDAKYAPGTVLVFGGNQEVTMSTETHDHKVAGVVSTNPAHIMNSGLQGEHTVEVALVGRVPVSVIGNISAGDRVVTSNRAGVAEALDITRYQPGVIIGKALQSHTGDEIGVIEVVVGRL